MVRQGGSAQKRADYEETGARRNPYLVDYERRQSRAVRGADGRAPGEAGYGGRADEARRPIAYGSRMAEGRRSVSDEGTVAAGSGSALDVRVPPDRQMPDEGWMPEEEYLPSRPVRTAGTAGRAGSGSGREVTADMFGGYGGREPVRKGKIVQVPIPDSRDRKRRPPEGRTRQRQQETSARLREFSERDRGFLPQEEHRRPESRLSQKPKGTADSRAFVPIDRGMRREAGRGTAGQKGDISRQYREECRKTMTRQPDRERGRSMPRRRNAAALHAAPRQSRRQRVLMQRLLLGAWVLCIFLFAGFFALKNHLANAEERNALPVSGGAEADGQAEQPAGTFVQGIPADDFAKHPEWTEDFLTPNEYSRPGEPLESVENVFVHYTANPGTSAAQNRSYFEWQKDTHEASVSAHFVIGYEGEIIQCVPLDEIAYAVMTRNYDSVSIECCYLAEDGSFTQETYDSLISLLAWLTDIYGLDSEDILRHYDCGGKKCPLYYTEHEDAWEQLKKDVDKL